MSGPAICCQDFQLCTNSIISSLGEYYKWFVKRTTAQTPTLKASYMNKIEILDKSGNVVGCVSYDYSITH